MKKFTVILSAALLLLAGTQANAQMSIGAGYVNSVESYKISKNADPSNNALNGFYAGLGYTIPVVGGLNFTPGVYYEFLTKGDATNIGGVANVSGKITEHYINVPLTFSFGAELTDGFRVFAYAGPTAAIGLASTTVYNGTVLGISAGSTVDNYNNDGYSRFDILLGAGLGFEIAELVRFNVGYDWGMLNRYIGGTEGVSRRNTRLTAGVAFLF